MKKELVLLVILGCLPIMGCSSISKRVAHGSVIDRKYIEIPWQLNVDRSFSIRFRVGELSKYSASDMVEMTISNLSKTEVNLKRRMQEADGTISTTFITLQPQETRLVYSGNMIRCVTSIWSEKHGRRSLKTTLKAVNFEWDETDKYSVQASWSDGF